MSDSSIKKSVMEHYAAIAEGRESCCGGPTNAGGCCSPQIVPESMSRLVGYADQEMAEVPEGANLGLGCGNPIALASLQPGETVVDRGSGAGFDCFLAANRVGREGKVIGVDMTHAMLEKARQNAEKGGYKNVEFRLGEIEHLPVADNTADIVISNCVINLSTDKPRVFAEALRILKPSGRLMVSDLVLKGPLPESVRRSVEAYAGCISGAMKREEYLAAIEGAGFTSVEILAEAVYPIASSHADASETAVLTDDSISEEDLKAAAKAVVSVKVRAVKP
ncbi:MAG: arsenite methyltransferase [Acidobacteriota bacterium]